MSFQYLGLSQPVLRALASKNYTEATPIQLQAIPIVLGGHDLLGIAQTGTGKTAAFMLPSIDALVEKRRVPRPATCRMLVLAPTRELASQIAESARAYSRFSNLSATTAFGGVPIGKQRKALERGVDILVATPGRLLDLVDQRFLSLREVEILVLDEADQMLDLGFIHALNSIAKMVPAQRQTLFFSATMPPAIRKIAERFLTKPQEVKVAPEATTAERVDQYVSFLQNGEKQALLTMMLRTGFSERGNMDRVLIFTRTKRGADKVVRALGANGIQAVAIHGNKSQPQREAALAAFRACEIRVLVATDIAARGIDIPGVSHVINFELPNVPEQYVHRIGRTARAGADGIAIAYCAEDERPYLKDIEKLTRQKIAIAPLPDNFVSEASRVVSAPAPAKNPPRHGQRQNLSRQPTARPNGSRRPSRQRRRSA
ncbi:DEAD/DEAH box helicase [Sphingomonas piscis]|uniref:DEAD/DEAH box helicase n=1 Tax=Sphingomonas piscis TaxID=2714943 RepID=A0A6G7YSL3_9SPHN|nr:DEAD/DEAH box helicase [Sphingomonas piscis]QIK79722.1 DEAD/DEAH box helicase [Sphingomonas piscis]